jgi:hypothetical protein
MALFEHMFEATASAGPRFQGDELHPEANPREDGRGHPADRRRPVAVADRALKALADAA